MAGLVGRRTAIDSGPCGTGRTGARNGSWSGSAQHPCLGAVSSSPRAGPPRTRPMVGVTEWIAPAAAAGTPRSDCPTGGRPVAVGEKQIDRTVHQYRPLTSQRDLAQGWLSTHGGLR